MSRLHWQITSLVLVLALGAVAEGFGQTVSTTTGAINGKITDTSGRRHARRHRVDRQSVDAGHANGRHRRGRHLPLLGDSAGRLHGHLRARGFRT